MSKDVFYFPPDSNARQDPRVLVLRARMGHLGYAFYFMTLELLREQDGYRLPVDEYLGQSLAAAIDCPIEDASRFLAIACEIGLFNKDSHLSAQPTRRLAMLEEERVRVNYRNRQQRMKAAREKGRHTREEWFRLVAEFGGQCVRCGTTERRVEKDHILPVYLGGSDSIKNLQPICARCNCSKGPEKINWVSIRRREGFAT